MEGRTTFRDRSYLEVTFAPEPGREQRILLDPASLLQRLVLENDPDQGHLLETRMSDYRDIRGVQMPFRTEHYRQGELQWVYAVKRVEFNLGVPDGAFAPPE